MESARRLGARVLRSLELDRITPFHERGDHHLEQGRVVGHVEIHEDQPRSNEQPDALHDVRHVGREGLQGEVRNHGGTEENARVSKHVLIPMIDALRRRSVWVN